jgi:hypothetical protein
VQLAAIQARVEGEFGIAIPIGALDTLLRGAAKKRKGRMRGRAFVPEQEGLAEFDTAHARTAAHREQMALIERLVEAAAEQELTWSEDAAAEAMADYLDRHATSVLVVSHGQDPPTDENQPDAEGDADPREFVVATVFDGILAREPEAAVHVERLVVGTMLASALYTPDLEKLFDPLCCDVFLDSPILIDALGHAGAIPKRAARESITLLREAGATIKCFEHSISEVERKLEDVAHQLRDPRRAPQGTDTILHNATERNLTPSDLQQAATSVRRSVKNSLGIEVVEAPPFTESTTIDEVVAERVLEERLGHSRKTTIRFDLDSLTAVYRIRGGQAKYRIESCQAIFATPHRRLVGASREIFRIGRKNAPIAIALADLVTLAWLKKPRAVPQLPRLRIAADCYAAIQPPAGVVRRYVEEATKLFARGEITGDDLYELRYTPESRRILMMKTKGIADAVNATVVSDILKERNRQIEAKARREVERDAHAAREQLADEQAARTADREKFESRIRELETNATTQDAQLAELQSAAERRRIRVRVGLSTAVVAACLAGASIPLATGTVDGAWTKTLLVVAAAAVACVALIPHVGHKRVWAGVGAAGLVIGIVLAIHQVASDSSHHTPPKTPHATTNP